jgi:hypothetical protein
VRQVVIPPFILLQGLLTVFQNGVFTFSKAITNIQQLFQNVKRKMELFFNYTRKTLIFFVKQFNTERQFLPTTHPLG